jgi:hypothetical protein
LNGKEGVREELNGEYYNPDNLLVRLANAEDAAIS